MPFFEGIRSERQLMEMVNLNLMHRWFIGYDLDEPVPDPSSLSKIRDRTGLGAFQLFFEEIGHMCNEAGHVWGEELNIDTIKVQANADINSMVNKTEFEAQSHLEELIPSNPYWGGTIFEMNF
ncbi:MAG: transposase [Anaerolineales bacterium]|nr:transposase [Anaerolineales bacterium]